MCFFEIPLLCLRTYFFLALKYQDASRNQHTKDSKITLNLLITKLVNALHFEPFLFIRVNPQHKQLT